MEKEIDALEQLKLIKSTVLDQDGLLPVSGKDLIIWGVISIVLFMVMPLFFVFQEFKDSIVTSSAFMTVFLLFGTFMSYKLIKQKNEKKDRKFSKYQKMLRYLSTSSIALGFLLSILLSFKYSVFIPLIWMILIGMIFIVDGFFSKQILTKYGLFLAGAGFVVALILLLGVLFSVINVSSFYLYYSCAFFASLSLGLGMIILGRKFQKEESLNV